MTPAELRRICESLDDASGKGGQTRLARLLRWSDRKVRRKLAGEPVSYSDELAIRHVVECQRRPLMSDYWPDSASPAAPHITEL